MRDCFGSAPYYQAIRMFCRFLRFLMWSRSALMSRLVGYRFGVDCGWEVSSW